MDSLPQWESLSQVAQAHLLRSVQAMLDAGARCMPCGGDAAIWNELVSEGVVAATTEAAGAMRLTGPGTCLILDILVPSFAEETLMAA